MVGISTRVGMQRITGSIPFNTEEEQKQAAKRLQTITKTSNNRQSPVMLKESTITQLRQLYRDLHYSREDVFSYDSLLLELIRTYRRRKEL